LLLLYFEVVERYADEMVRKVHLVAGRSEADVLGDGGLEVALELAVVYLCDL
jgi:hypothetical protein